MFLFFVFSLPFTNKKDLFNLWSNVDRQYVSSSTDLRDLNEVNNFGKNIYFFTFPPAVGERYKYYNHPNNDGSLKASLSQISVLFEGIFGFVYFDLWYIWKILNKNEPKRLMSFIVNWQVLISLPTLVMKTKHIYLQSMILNDPIWCVFSRPIISVAISPYKCS